MSGGGFSVSKTMLFMDTTVDNSLHMVVLFVDSFCVIFLWSLFVINWWNYCFSLCKGVWNSSSINYRTSLEFYLPIIAGIEVTWILWWRWNSPSIFTYLSTQTEMWGPVWVSPGFPWGPVAETEPLMPWLDPTNQVCSPAWILSLGRSRGKQSSSGLVGHGIGLCQGTLIQSRELIITSDF